jgi:hypothetical protein
LILDLERPMDVVPVADRMMENAVRIVMVKGEEDKVAAGLAAHLRTQAR